MKINWKVRLKNPVWWMQVVLALITPVMGYLGITAADITTWQVLGELLLKAFSNPYVIGLMLLSLWSTINDPTTKGLSDSRAALTYENPKV